MTNNGFVTISLTNAIGQTISTQTLYVNAGRQTNVSFATSNLPSGVYLYTATVDGRQTTGRVSITH
jgi:hypothetical protein